MTDKIILEDLPVGKRLIVGSMSIIVGKSTGIELLSKARRAIESKPEGTPNREEALRLINRYCN